MGGNRQSGVLAGDNFKWSTRDVTGKIVFRDSPWKPQRCGREKNRLDAAHHCHRTSLLFGPVLRDKPRLFARRDIDAHEVRLLNLNSCRPEINPTSLLVFCDHGILSADVLSTVILVDLGRGEFENVNVFASLNVFRNRSCHNEFGRNRLVILHSLANRVD